MTLLAPKLFDRRYDQLLELGRAQLPRLAPEWTDFNAHDPGITLLELLAWVTEAQLYAVGRTSRSERLAYASFFGLAPTGTRPARGLIWPGTPDGDSLGAAYAGSQVIAQHARVELDQQEGPRFGLERRVLVTPGRIVSLIARLGDGTEVDLKQANARGAEFRPLGARAGRRDTLALEFETHAREGLLPAHRAEAAGAFWVIGVRAAPSGPSDVADASFENRLSVSIVRPDGRRTPLEIEDTTAGLLRTGAIAIDVSPITDAPSHFWLEIRAPRGLARPPRLLRIEPNVLPITQRHTIERERNVATGVPDFECDLEVPGLCLGGPGDSFDVEVADGGAFERWERCDRLSEKGPEDPAYELDAERRRLRFGNGVNGRRLGRDAEISVSYSVSDGVAGNVAPNRKWRVSGFSGVFGTNLDPVDGGTGQSDLLALRREARLRLARDHALVSADDLVGAARELPLLEVARAWVVRPSRPSAGGVTLVAMRARRPGDDPELPPESRRWLRAVHAALAPRVPLGTRLSVRAPRYVDFAVRAELEIAEKRAPADVERDARRALEERLALVSSALVKEPREPGVPVTRSDVAAWLLGVRGVSRIKKLELAGGSDPGKVAVPRNGLPRLNPARSEIRAERAQGGGRP